jgi:hypothetical protein
MWSRWRWRGQEGAQVEVEQAVTTTTLRRTSVMMMTLRRRVHRRREAINRSLHVSSISIYFL